MWCKFFQKEEAPNLLKIVQFVCSVPVSYAFVERIFSVMGNVWTDERNRLAVNTVKSELCSFFNITSSCTEFKEAISTNKPLCHQMPNIQRSRLERRKSVQDVKSSGRPQTSHTDENFENVSAWVLKSRLETITQITEPVEICGYHRFRYLLRRLHESIRKNRLKLWAENECFA
ncbi:dimer_Tnp_hAT domain-containing protein [Trichonephila clavipes]|nr:dimer_Tnp_hAT domain-containing protein [Trichonephila clavipes]